MDDYRMCDSKTTGSGIWPCVLTKGLCSLDTFSDSRFKLPQGAFRNSAFCFPINIVSWKLINREMSENSVIVSSCGGLFNLLPVFPFLSCEVMTTSVLPHCEPVMKFPRTCICWQISLGHGHMYPPPLLDINKWLSKLFIKICSSEPLES